MIGIIGAMQIEVEALLQDMKEPTLCRMAGSDFYRGTIDGVEVVVVRCGIGKVAAAVAAQAMILRYAPTLILNTGVGGALADALSVGDLVISTEAVEHDMDTSPLGDPVGFISGINRIALPARPQAVEVLLACAQTLGLRAFGGRIASGDQFIASAEKRAYIKNTFDAMVCEMEGAAVAHACYLNDTPFVIVRAVSDRADGSSHVDYPTFLAAAAKASYTLVRSFLKAY